MAGDVRMRGTVGREYAQPPSTQVVRRVNNIAGPFQSVGSSRSKSSRSLGPSVTLTQETLRDRHHVRASQEINPLRDARISDHLLLHPRSQRGQSILQIQ